MNNHNKPGSTIHWQAYLMEAAGLAGFVIVAGLSTIFLEHPSLPVMRGTLSQHALVRRILLALVMGGYVAGVTALFSKRSGAHLNPSITLSFLSLGKMNPVPAIGYITAQFAGACIAVMLLVFVTGNLFSHPAINYAITEPKPPYGMATAFTAECVISFIMMFAVLATASSKRFEKYAPLVAGICIGVFIALELPLSGMSMNPARSFAASLAANKWNHLWIYFLAPVASMLVATEVFLRWKEKRSLFSKRHNIGSVTAKEPDYQELKHFPVQE